MRSSRRNSPRLGCEAFEDRVLLSAGLAHSPTHLQATVHQLAKPSSVASPGRPPHALSAHAHPLLYKVLAPTVAHPLASGGPPSGALTPAEVRQIYGFDNISNLGAGQTIAIVDAYDDPNIGSDANVFDKAVMTTIGGTTSYYTAYGASSTWLTKVYPTGQKPAGNTGWGQEISLDVEWAHAIAPQAKIMLVEAKSTSFSALLGADTYAASHGATVISNSWGGGESRGEASYDSTFSSNNGTASKGVTFVFSAGDSGDQSYPALSPYVVSVGGTTLSYDSSYNWTGETGWSDGGGGVSAYESKPSYQSGLSYSKRANPDIAYDADPNSGFAVYDSYGGYDWKYIFGGTSAGAPQWSALIALADQGRVAAKKAALDGYSQTLPAIYAMAAGTDGSEPLYDVTSGSNSEGSAGPGYDLVTGRGTPRRADLVYAALVST